MKTLFIVTILFVSMSSASEFEDKEIMKHNLEVIMQEKAAEIKQAELEYNLWNNGLNKYLFEHIDPNIRVLGVRYLIRMAEGLADEYSAQVIENQESIEELINELVSDKDISPQALIVLESICQSKKYTRKCDEKLLSKTRIEIEPDNINSYLSLLDRAVKANDVIYTNEVLTMMAQAKYNNNHYYVMPELETAIREYEKQNPFPQSYIETNKAMYAELIGFSDSKLQDMFDNMQEYMLFGLLIGYKLAIPMPNYAPIKTTCKTDLTASENCLKIA